MKRPTPSALDRLRELFQMPQSFGAAPGTAPPGPPAASLRASPHDPGQTDDTPWTDPGRVGRNRFDPGLPGIRALALAGLLAALIAGAYLWWSRPDPQPAPQPVVHPAAHPAAMTSAARSAPSPSPTTLVVDVAGKVRHPGVVTLPAGARVIDAIKAAGGARPGAKTDNLNLARHIIDGEQILVGITAPPQATAPPTSSTGPPGSAPPGTPLDLNTATATQLDQLPGVGPVLAQRIVDYRTQHSGFHAVDELRQVSGIGQAKFADLKPLVRV
jgi:competence protein ComEA